MKTLSRGALYWAARILGLCFAVFISLFALDVFGGNESAGTKMLAFLMHLIPTFVLLGILAIAWRWEWVGAIAFPALGIAYIVTAWGRFPWGTYLVIAGPLFVLGGLFLANWLGRRRLSGATAA